MRTRFTELVGCSVPVQQAPMGMVSGPSLAAAAVSAGAMGTVGLTGFPVGAIIEYLDAVNSVTRGPVGGNFVLPFLEDKAAITVCAERARVVDLYHAWPDATLVDIAHAAGALVCWQVGALDEARAAVDCGADFLAVRGTEGGGRMHGNRALWPLLCDVLDAVGDRVPVLAAGGIGTGRGMAAALVAGADGVRIGTVLAATVESVAHPIYKQALIDASATDSVLTNEFSTGWPGGPHAARVLQSCIAAARDIGSDVVGEAPMGGAIEPVARFAPSPPTADFVGRIDAMALYAGESVAFVHASEPAATVIARIVEEAESLIASAAERT